MNKKQLIEELQKDPLNCEVEVCWTRGVHQYVSKIKKIEKDNNVMMIYIGPTDMSST